MIEARVCPTKSSRDADVTKLLFPDQDQEKIDNTSRVNSVVR